MLEASQLTHLRKESGREPGESDDENFCKLHINLLSLLPLICCSTEIKSEIPNMKRAYALVLGDGKEKALSCVHPGLPEKMEIQAGGWPRQRGGRQGQDVSL